MQSIILHLDMNSYFASVEQQANPHLRGRPVGVCEHLGGIIIAPSVEAKRMGIVLGTPVWEARKICPNIVLLPVDPPKCRSVTERFNRILEDYGDEVERYSIDESFVDITETCGGSWDDALLLALSIKQRLRREVGEWVSCSIGIGPNKLVAKIAADLGEGDIDRICVIRPPEIESLYDRLNLTDIPGIGKRLERALNKLGVFTLRQLRDYSVANLLNQFGIGGWVLHGLGNFNAPSPLSPPTGGEGKGGGRRGEEGELPKSIGHAYTLPRAITEVKEIKRLMMKLCEKVGRRMRKHGARGSVVHYFDSNFHKQRKLPNPICGGREIYRAAWGVFKEGLRLRSGNRLVPELVEGLRIKIMGITMSGLVFSAPPEPLWPHLKKPFWAAAASDRINDKYGEFTIYPGRLLGIPEEWGKDTVGFAR